jgi:hypothetical protein
LVGKEGLSQAELGGVWQAKAGHGRARLGRHGQVRISRITRIVQTLEHRRLTMIKDLAIEELLVWHTERAVMTIFSRETINPCLLKWKQKTQFDVYNQKDEEMQPIYAKSVNDIRLLNKFFASEDGQDLDRGSLDNIQEKVTRCITYLIHKYKKKYQYIKSSEQIRDFTIMVCFIMAIRSAEWRFEEKRFQDPAAAQRVARLLVRRAENEALSKAHGHEKKHGEDATFTKTMDEFQGKVDTTCFLDYEEIPALPSGLAHPLTWLLKRLEEDN